MMMMMVVMMVCETHVFHNSYNQLLLPPTPSKKQHIIMTSFLDGALDSKQCSNNRVL
jgi:hypothetical protein